VKTTGRLKNEDCGLTLCFNIYQSLHGNRGSTFFICFAPPPPPLQIFSPPSPIAPSLFPSLALSLCTTNTTPLSDSSCRARHGSAHRVP